VEARRFGRIGEWIAVLWLVAHGYRIRHRNWTGGTGEIDLVAQRGTTIVFVEVKSRVREDFGGAVAAVNRSKQRTIRRAARAYLSRHRLWESPTRFDVIAVQRRAGFVPWRIEHVRDAFQSDSGRIM
jgi:putative endonuclease